MAQLYADEQFPRQVVELLRSLGHSVLTVQEAGQANQRISDDLVLQFATERDCAVLTMNRRDFIKLHKRNSMHAGIIVCTEPYSWKALAEGINEAIEAAETLTGKLIRINRTPSAKN